MGKWYLYFFRFFLLGAPYFRGYLTPNIILQTYYFRDWSASLWPNSESFISTELSFWTLSHFKRQNSHKLTILYHLFVCMPASLLSYDSALKFFTSNISPHFFPNYAMSSYLSLNGWVFYFNGFWARLGSRVKYKGWALKMLVFSACL